jgi:hypothetical protein
MVDQPESNGARKPNPVRHFFADVVNGIRGSAVGWISAAIFGLVVAGGGYYWKKVRDTAKEAALSRTNISAAEAMAEARRDIGSSALWAVPFKNRDDPTQYVAVWYAAGDEPECVQEPCLDQLGSTKVDLLVGNGGLFERAPTGVRFGPDFAISQEDMAAPERRDWFAQHGGITDWNGDGVREIFSIAATTGTAATHYYVLSLFDTKARKTHRLEMTVSRTSSTPKYIGTADPAMRAWLGRRFEEYTGSWELKDCSRRLSGELQCRGHEPADPIEEDAEKSGKLVRALMDAWIVEHGRDFVSGKLRLQFKPGLITSSNEACFDYGGLEWLNMFKGPLVVNDRQRNRSAIVYIQDGDHHREIPSVIRGRSHVWLGLADKRQLLAIDPQSWRIERIDIPEWEHGIPDPYEPGKMLQSTATKEQQIDSLEVSGGRLVYAGKPLTLVLNGQAIDQSKEFASARQCSI